MDITNYVVGLVTGVSVTTFFIGKEWYKYYTRYTIQKKQLDRVLKLNDKIKNYKQSETSTLSASMRILN
ncbi:hypothetical protein ACRASX_12355 [Flavobacterium sp. TMP13]|uniref:hypothetical protein n=1 Tax=unclassified Flavobacterium TaxID=196869 RepID=UPI00076CD2C8|nr:hypothetical protein [Flavobacterium sp. TAB 87]KVV15076.1 hypothetical protein AP058_01178 [Flavobacterium sp. TAB 87]